LVGCPQRRKCSNAIILVVGLSVAVALPIVFAPVETRAAEPRTLQLLVVLDGLRPDYVIPRLMPRLSQLADDGVRFTNHHSVFPTVTRVNASSIATGAYPERHGLLGNAVFFPHVDPKAGLDTSNRNHLLRIQESEATLLDVPDLGSILSAAGRTLLVASAGSTGSSYLLNHRTGSPGMKGGILHTEYTSPPELHARLVERLGAPPREAQPDAGRNRWIVDALLQVGLDHFRPEVVILWLSDPDTTAHERGIGAPRSEDALRRVDAELGRLLDELARRGLRTNVFVTSDHGFSTHRAPPDLGSIFARFRATTAVGEPDLVFAGQAVYDRTGRPEHVRRMVEALQAQKGVGAIFTAPAAPGDLRGSIPGTLSFDAARWGHPRAGAILISPDWSDDKNETGWPGTSASTGVAGHGSSGRWDVHATLIAAGPDLRAGAVSQWPTANVDLAPTLCRLTGIDVPSSMQGRVLEEALAGTGATKPDGEPTTSVTRVENQVGTIRYSLSGHFSEVAGSRYLDYTVVEREAAR
jgi:predicted AlkP superfamily pyrophosphatase or phosphodiesterase